MSGSVVPATRVSPCSAGAVPLAELRLGAGRPKRLAPSLPHSVLWTIQFVFTFRLAQRIFSGRARADPRPEASTDDGPAGSDTPSSGSRQLDRGLRDRVPGGRIGAIAGEQRPQITAPLACRPSLAASGAPPGGRARLASWKRSTESEKRPGHHPPRSARCKRFPAVERRVLDPFRVDRRASAEADPERVDRAPRAEDPGQLVRQTLAASIAARSSSVTSGASGST